MKVYLAGPMRGYHNFNFEAFDAATAYLREHGVEVRSPAEHDRENGFDETLNSLDGFDLGAALLWDLNQIYECDAIVLLPGWSRSSGCDLELHMARFIGRRVLYYHPDARLRLKDNPLPTDALVRVP